MNIYENVATESIASFFRNEPVWKKEILFDFLLNPFELKMADIRDVKTQEALKGTTPDFTVITKKGKEIHFEVKINDTGLTDSERDASSRDAFLIRKNYYYLVEIPLPPEKILFWEDLFEAIDRLGATKDFARLDLVREYMKEEVHTLLLTPHEVAMLYSPETIKSVYTMSNKILELCKNFLDSYSNVYECHVQHNQWGNNPQQDEWGIGYYFNEKEEKKRRFFIGISPSLPEPYDFSVALQLDSEKENLEEKNWYTDDDYAYFPLAKEILAKCGSDEELQEKFNQNVEEVLKSIS